MIKSNKGLTPASSAKRLKILEAARELFFNLGFAGTSIDKIVAVAGGSKSTVYRFFKSKEAILKELLDHEIEGHLGSLWKINQESTPIKEGLMLIGEEALLVLTSKHSTEIHRLSIGEANRVPSIGKIFYENGPNTGHMRLENYLHMQAKLGHFKCTDAGKAAEYFWAMLMHKVMMERYLGISKPMDKKSAKSLAKRTVEDFLTLKV